MRRITLIALLTLLSMSISLSSYGRPSPYDDIASIITATENKLYHAKSFEEIENLQYELLRNMTKCLDTKHKGYRYVEGSEEYKRIMKRLDRYNIIYCRSLSRFNPELNTETGNKEKVIRVLAIMRKMENSALTKKEGFNASNGSPTKNKTNDQSVFPTQEEIRAVNSKLPAYVSEGTLNTKIEYDNRTKVQTFYYRFTQAVDENLINKEVISRLKSNMVSALKKNVNNVKRLKAGMTFLYVYYSVDKRKLYEIKINSNDINYL